MVIGRVKALAAKEEFYPSWLSFFTSPYYIARKGLLDHVTRIAPILHGRILDFGCGSKPYQKLFVNSESYLGVDIEVSGHDHSTSNIDYYYNGSSLPFGDDEFDNIVSFEVFEHVINLYDIIPELSRVIKDNGTLIVTMPFVFPEHENPYDFRRFTVNGMSAFLDDNGFDIVNSHKYPSAILTMAQSFTHYVFQNLSPRNSVAKTVFHFLFSFPAMCFALVVNTFLPKSSDFYMASMVVARKRSN